MEGEGDEILKEIVVTEMKILLTASLLSHDLFFFFGGGEAFLTTKKFFLFILRMIKRMSSSTWQNCNLLPNFTGYCSKLLVY